jgi:hypothetical protein
MCDLEDSPAYVTWKVLRYPKMKLGYWNSFETGLVSRVVTHCIPKLRSVSNVEGSTRVPRFEVEWANLGRNPHQSRWSRRRSSCAPCAPPSHVEVRDDCAAAGKE